MSSTSNFRQQTDRICHNILLLLQVFAKIDLSTVDALYGIDDELGTLANGVTLLSYHLHLQSRADDSRGWWNRSIFEALLESTDLCLLRFIHIVRNGPQPNTQSLEDRLKTGNLESEVRHLRMRLTVCITAFSAPVMMSALHAMRPSMGKAFDSLGAKTMEDWVDELCNVSHFLATDGRISSSERMDTDAVTGVPTLHQQRKDLAHTIEGLAEALIKADSGSSTPIPSSPTQPSNSEIDKGNLTPGLALCRPLSVPPPTSLEILTAFSPGILTPSTKDPGRRESKTSFSAIEDPDYDVAGLANSMLGISGFSPLTDDAVGIAGCHSAHHHHSRITPFPQQGPSRLPRLQIDKSLSDLLNVHSLETASLPYDPDELINNYTHARHLLAQGKGNLVLPILQSLSSSVMQLYRFWPPPSVLENLPTRAQVLLDICHAYLLCRPQQTPRALALLTELIKWKIDKELNYGAAHLLAKLHWQRGDLEDARMYCKQAVTGRVEALGFEHEDTRKSLGLMVRLSRRVGDKDEDWGVWWEMVMDGADLGLTDG